MIGWIQVAIGAAATGTLVFLVVVLLQHYCFDSKPPENTRETSDSRERAASLQTGIARLHHVSTLHQHLDKTQSHKRSRSNYYVFRRGMNSKPLFSWSDNPSLVTDAVENGWSRFAFTAYTSSPSVRSARSLFGACAVGDQGKDVEISWEVCQGSADFMQKIRLNSGLKKINTSVNPASMAVKSVIKAALPLPGPPLGNTVSFPQEAYFEITILSFEGDDSNDLIGKVMVGKREGEKTKLIQENFSAETNSESLVHVTSNSSSRSSRNGNGNGKLEELRLNVKEDRIGEMVNLSVGLTGGGSLPLKLPGSYSGSVGFNSNGSVYLDGIKLVFESEEEEWGRIDRVIGCGYNPSQKKVFFTVDSQLVHEIHCKSEEFGTPLYPTLAANTDIMVLVNFGQSVFKYAPANQQRTPNPCFVGPMANSPALGYEEDSKELFSMGRIDAQWLNRSTTRPTYQYNGSNNRGGVDFDEVSEGDLFEIVLDSSGRSPRTL
ncbi:hypothetical protein RJ640_001178 [Escallonia rubra]|uniref:SPRY domain-containing protein n=1 Tax=Escallonia rubra TaxID=112253 RepID=A0AA88SK37_9ASTE|nr:hypothetical protein RJ640_001178 [Escallonia rubra]